MEIQAKRDGNIATLNLIGQMWERDDAEALEQQISLLETQDTRCVIIALERLTFISSIGLGAIAKAYRMLQKANRELILYRPMDNVKEAISMLEFPRIMNVADTEQELSGFLDRLKNRP
jgi:anti-anti-sigma factor